MCGEPSAPSKTEKKGATHRHISIAHRLLLMGQSDSSNSDDGFSSNILPPPFFFYVSQVTKQYDKKTKKYNQQKKLKKKKKKNIFLFCFLLFFFFSWRGLLDYYSTYVSGHFPAGSFAGCCCCCCWNSFSPFFEMKSNILFDPFHNTSIFQMERIAATIK